MIQQDWIKRIKQGDREAFRLLYEQSVDHVFRTVSFLIRDKQDASDVVHEVYVENGQVVVELQFWQAVSRLVERTGHPPNFELEPQAVAQFEVK